MIFIDKNNVKLKNGDVINIHQTVNGQSLFIIKSISPLDIRYHNDIEREYEYDKTDLLSASFGEISFEIIDEYPLCLHCGDLLLDEYCQTEGYCRDCL